MRFKFVVPKTLQGRVMKSPNMEIKLSKPPTLTGSPLENKLTPMDRLLTIPSNGFMKGTYASI